MENMIEQSLIDILAKANWVAVLTGAGVSAESGISTFRDPDGLWSKFNPMELASIDGFMSNPNRVWEWYQYRRNIIHSTKPNAGHKAISEMQNLFPDFHLITQNVDRLHQTAGSEGVLELHGNIIENHCFECKKPYTKEIDLSENSISHCDCGGMIRPSVVWFGEMLPHKVLAQSELIAEKCDVFFSIGTSAEVYPAASLPIIAKKNGAKVVEINPNVTAISYLMDYVIRGTSAETLPLIVEEIKKARHSA